MYLKYNINDIIGITIFMIFIYAIIFITFSIIIYIIISIINKNFLKKEKFDNKVDCISFPFLCSTDQNKIENQYINFRLLHSSSNIKKAK